MIFVIFNLFTFSPKRVRYFLTRKMVAKYTGIEKVKDVTILPRFVVLLNLKRERRGVLVQMIHNDSNAGTSINKK